MIDARHRWVFPDPCASTRRSGPRPESSASACSRRRCSRGAASRTRRRSRVSSGRRGRPQRPAPAARRGRSSTGSAVRSGGERVMVFGDFDADGLTGLAQLVLAFRRLGIDTVPYVPCRLEEGHGLSTGGGRDRGPGGVALIVTVDTGSTSVDEVAAAAARGIDVIITDHHHLPDVLPAAVAIVNPQRADSAYPDAGCRGPASRSPSRGCCSASWPAPKPRPASSPTSRRSGRSRTSRRSWARTGRSPGSAWSGCGRRRGPGSRRCSRGPATRTPRSTSRPSGSCSRRGSTPPAGWGRPWTPPGSSSPRRPRRRPRWP